jgi:predicted Zn-dependent protease
LAGAATSVGERIAAAANKPEYKWEFILIQGKEVNAFGLPGGKVAFWKRMSKVAGDKPPEFLSTHPSDATRINQLKEWLPEARSYYRGK